MATASDLTEAAHLCADQMRLKQVSGALKTQLGMFINAADVVFPDAIPNNRPVGNWLIPLSSIHVQMVTLAQDAGRSYLGMNQAIDAVSKMCWAQVECESAGLTTNAQSIALLAAWNTAFGTP